MLPLPGPCAQMWRNYNILTKNWILPYCYKTLVKYSLWSIYEQTLNCEFFCQHNTDKNDKSCRRSGHIGSILLENGLEEFISWLLVAIRTRTAMCLSTIHTRFRVMTQWICAPPLLFSDKPTPLSMTGGIIEAGQSKKLSEKKKKKEKWLRDLIKSSLVDSDGWWRAHYEAWSFSNDTTLSRTWRGGKKKGKNLIRVTSTEWYCKPVNNMKIRRGSCKKKKEINLAGVHLAQIAKLWICFQIMSLPACQLTCHFL